MMRQEQVMFVEFEFGDCFYKTPQYYSGETIEARFEASVYEHRTDDDRFGPLLSIRDCGLDRAIKPTEGALVQVLHIMPMMIDHYLESSSLVLHEMTVKAWSQCKNHGCGFWSSSPKTILQPLINMTKLYMILDRAMSVKVLHTHKRCHLGLILDVRNFMTLKRISDELIQKIDDVVNLNGKTVHTGLNEQQAVQNCLDWATARSIKHNVFDTIFQCQVQVGADVTDPGLCGVNVILASDLELLFTERAKDGYQNAEQDD